MDGTQQKVNALERGQTHTCLGGEGDVVLAIHVNLQATLLGRGIRTQVASIGFLPGVDTHVPDHVVLLGECRGTVGALERLFPSVYHQVPLQDEFAVRRERTEPAPVDLSATATATATAAFMSTLEGIEQLFLADLCEGGYQRSVLHGGCCGTSDGSNV